MTMTQRSVLGAETTHSYWRRSSHSGTSGTCVEVANLDGGCCAVRDSKDPTGPALIFTPAEWAAFASGVHAGEFG